MALGSDVMSAALDGYALTKVSGKGTGLEILREAMSALYSSKPKTPADAPALPPRKAGAAGHRALSSTHKRQALVPAPKSLACKSAPRGGKGNLRRPKLPASPWHPHASTASRVCSPARGKRLPSKRQCLPASGNFLAPRGIEAVARGKTVRLLVWGGRWSAGCWCLT